MTDIAPRNEEIDAIVAGYRNRIHDCHLFLRPDIPAKKLTNAIAAYAPEATPDDVVALVDDTVVGSGKDGGLLTHSTLYAHEIASEPRHIDVTTITEIECANAAPAGSVVKVNGERFLRMSVSQREANRLFAEMLKQVASVSGAPLAAAGSATPVAPPRPDRRGEELAQPERLLTLLPFVQIERALQANESFAILVTNHRLVFTRLTMQIYKPIYDEAYRNLKAVKKGFFGPETWDVAARASHLLAQRYGPMSPATALHESDGNFAVPASEVVKIEVAPVWRGNPLTGVLYRDMTQQGTPEYTLLVISTARKSYALQVKPHWDAAAAGWKEAFDYLFGPVIVWNGTEPER
jgi:hypothetical protein